MASGTQSRLSLLDSTFLRIETAETPMHVAALQIFSIPDGASQDFVSEVVAAYRRRRPIAHPFNQLLVGGPLSMVTPSARTIDDIDVEYHVRHTALPAPGVDRELGELVSHLHSVVLDRTRPLWTCHVIEGAATSKKPRFAVAVDKPRGLRPVTRSLPTPRYGHGSAGVLVEAPARRTAA